MLTARSARLLLTATTVAAAVAAPAQATPEKPAGTLTKHAPSLTAAAGNPYTFVGSTGQFPCRMYDDVFCGTINVFMSKDMRRVKRLLLGFEATCQAPDKFFGTNMMLERLPAKKGRSGSSFKANVPAEAPLPGDLTARAQISLNGRAKWGATGQGSFKITVGIFDSLGQQIDSCTTGRQPFTLKALKRH